MGNDQKPPVDQKAAYIPPASEEEEEQRFHKHLGKFLEDDKPQDDTAKTKEFSTSSAPAASSSQPLDIEGAINKALDARESRQKTDGELSKLRADVEAMKPKPKKWYNPFTLFDAK
jgi:hypothetical protein